MSSILLAYLLALKLSPGSGHLVKFKDPRETGKFEEFTRSVIETQVSHRPGKHRGYKILHLVSLLSHSMCTITNRQSRLLSDVASFLSDTTGAQIKIRRIKGTAHVIVFDVSVRHENVQKRQRVMPAIHEGSNEGHSAMRSVSPLEREKRRLWLNDPLNFVGDHSDTESDRSET